MAGQGECVGERKKGGKGEWKQQTDLRQPSAGSLVQRGA